MADTITLPREAAQRLLDGLNARIDAAVEDHAVPGVPVFDGIVELHDALAGEDEIDPATVASAATVVLSWCAHVQRFSYERTGPTGGMDAAPHLLAGAAHGLALVALKPSQRAAFASLPAPITREAGLDVSIAGGRLIVSIGVDALMVAVKGGPAWSDQEEEERGWQITSPDGFAAEIAHALQDEEDDGTTLVHVMLDAAIERAIDQGSLNIDFGKDA